MPIARIWSTIVQGLGLAALLVLAAALWAPEPLLSPAIGQTDAGASPAAQPGVEVLARGPIHEAYAEPGGAKMKESPRVPKQPPDVIEEMPPDQKPDGDNVQWLPGYWAWDDEKTDYMWISGFWRVPPPGRQWVPGHWNQVDGGWQWVPGFWGQHQQEEITYLPPPPEAVEAGPSVPAPSPDHVYVSGCWIYRDGRYAWRPGFWCACRRGWVWTPAHYVWTPCGYVFVEGYWDYTLRERGLLFAPCYVDVTVCRRPGWVYTPTIVVQDECLFGALFVRPGCGCYYFGDYFEPCHRSAGYVAWCDVRVGGGCYGDPLFSYYSYHYRDDARWSVGIRTGYIDIYAGNAPRPPRTLIQQNTVVQNITVNNINNTVINNNTTINKNVNVTNNVNNVRNTTMLTSINSVKNVNLKPVTPQERTTAKTSAQQLVVASQQRGQSERQLLAQGPPPSKPTDAPRVAKVALPKTAAVPATGGAKAPPAPVTGAPHVNSAANTGAHPNAGNPALKNAATTGQPAGAHPGQPAHPMPGQPAHAAPAQPTPAQPAHPMPGQPGQPGHPAPTDHKAPPPHPNPPAHPTPPADSKHDKKDKDSKN